MSGYSTVFLWQEIKQTWERWLRKTEQKLEYLEQVLLFKTSVYMKPSIAESWFAYGQWSSTNKYIKSKRLKSTSSSGREWAIERTENCTNEKIAVIIMWVRHCWFKSQTNYIVNIRVFTGILCITHIWKSSLWNILTFYGDGQPSSAFWLAVTVPVLATGV